MPERFLEVVRQSNGIDTVVQSFPIDVKDTVRIHHPDGEEGVARVVIRHPRTAYDKIEREILPGEPETVLVPEGGDATNVEAAATTPAESPQKPKTTARKSAAKKK